MTPPRSRGWRLPHGAAASVLLPLAGPSGREPDANLLRRGILKVLRENAADRARGAEIAAAFHDDPGEAGHPWAVSPPFSYQGEVLCRLTAVGIATAEELADVLEPGSALVPEHWKIGPLDRWRVCAVDIDSLAGDPAVVGARRLGVSLLSPAAISGLRRGSYGSVTPRALIEGWRRRWVAHLGFDHPLAEVIAPVDRGQPDPFGDWVRDEVGVCSAELSMAPYDLPFENANPALATSGAVVLEIAGPWSPARAAVNALWRFSLFCGSGRHLNLGFGQTLPFPVSTQRRPERRPVIATPGSSTRRIRLAGAGIGALVGLHPHGLPVGREALWQREAHPADERPRVSSW